MEVKNYLLDYNNLFIIQDTNMFSFSLDSVLLANFATINKACNKILDIGTGNAPIPLMLSTKTDSKIVGVEIQKEVSDLAKKSVEINSLENQIKIVNEDINDFYLKCESDSFDVITCNPPYFKDCIINNSLYKTVARHENFLTLNKICKISKKVLKNKGNLVLVHRPERFVEIIDEMRKNNIEPKRVRFVYPKIGKEANILLIEGKKNGRPGLKILDPLYVHSDDGSYTFEVEKFFKGEKNDSE
ncbi:MAG: tRNA1(Val) (adenine(37)-N6)-methyltransferase [Bacilli bacterium]|nr:tRNA1(Val) (adenine(37)-N6)-methyltransferase [Bacilli bacterium]